MLPILYTTPLLSSRALTHIFFFSFFCFAAALLLLIRFFYLFDLLASPHTALDEPIDRVVVTSCHNRLDSTNLHRHTLH